MTALNTNIAIQHINLYQLLLIFFVKKFAINTEAIIGPIKLLKNIIINISSFKNLILNLLYHSLYPNDFRF